MLKKSDFISINNLNKKTAEIFAIIGGIFLCLIIFIVCTNVFTRKIDLPIPGDVEIVELIICVTIFFFLPYCQITKSNIKKIIFSKLFPEKLNRLLDLFGIIFFTIFSILLAWRMFLGGIDFYNYNDSTMVLNIPRFIFFFPITASLIVLISTCFLEIYSYVYNYYDR